MAPHEGAPTQLSTLHDNSFRFSFFLLLLSTLPQALSLRFIFSFSSFFTTPNPPFLSLLLSVFFFFTNCPFFPPTWFPDTTVVFNDRGRSMAFGDKPSRKGSSDTHQKEPDEHEGKHVRFDSRITLLLLQYPLIYFFFSFLALRSRATHPLSGSSMKRFFQFFFF